MTDNWIIHPRSKEKFTFPQGFIQDIRDGFEMEIDQNKMPGAGPMFNQGFDGSGIGKTISIDGTLYDTAAKVTSVNNIRDKYIMKLWLETIPAGFNSTPCECSFMHNDLAIQSTITTTEFTDDVSGETVVLEANFVPLKARIVGLSFNDSVSNGVSIIKFTMSLWVCGF